MRTDPRPRRIVHPAILIAAVLLGLAACGGEPAPSGSPPAGGPPSLAGTSWVVVSVAGRGPVPGVVPTVAFSADRVSGFGGCNQFGGAYRLDPATGQFAAREVSSTLIGCVQPGVGDIESGLLGALGAATRAGLDPDGRLVLEGPAGRLVLARFQPPAGSG